MAAKTCVRSVGDKRCVLHPDEKLIFECTRCDGELACIECITSVHQGHVMVKIKEKGNEKIVTINSFIQHTKEQTLPALEKEIKHNISTLLENEQTYQGEIREVKKQETRLKELVEVYSVTKISRLEFLLKETKDMLEQRITYLEKLQQDLVRDTEEYEQTVKSGSDVCIHDTQIKIMKRTDVNKLYTVPAVTTSTFSPCKDPKEYIERAFGEFKEVKSGDRKTALVETEYRILDQPSTLNELFTPYSVSLHGMYCTPDNNTWILDKDGKLHSIDHIGKEQQTTQPDVQLYKICTHPITGEMFCTTRTNDKSIRRVNTQRGPTSVMFHTDCDPHTIGCTTDNHIVVYMKDSTIRKYNFDGQVLNTYKYTRSDIPGISVCRNTNKIALTGGKDGTVTVLDHSLVELYQYKGNDGQVFYTAAFVDKYLLVGDYWNKNILVLDKDTLVRTIDTKEMSYVAALSVQHDGVLLVGCHGSLKILLIKCIE